MVSNSVAHWMFQKMSAGLSFSIEIFSAQNLEQVPYEGVMALDFFRCNNFSY